MACNLGRLYDDIVSCDYKGFGKKDKGKAMDVLFYEIFIMQEKEDSAAEGNRACEGSNPSTPG